MDAMGQCGKAGAAPHQLVVQRLSAEPDNKQTYRPVQPREFVCFEFGDLTLTKPALLISISQPVRATS